MLVDMDAMKVKFDQILPYLNKSLKRKYLATEVLALGQGGIKLSVPFLVSTETRSVLVSRKSKLQVMKPEHLTTSRP